jgi:hypothetical protein
VEAEAAAVREGDPVKLHLPDGAQAGGLVIVALDADELGEKGRLESFLWCVAFGAVVETRGALMKDPRAGLENAQAVFQPDRAVGGAVRNADGIRAGLGEVDDVALIQHQRFAQAVGASGQMDIDILLLAGFKSGNACKHGLPGLVQHRQRRVNRAWVLIVAVR